MPGLQQALPAQRPQQQADADVLPGRCRQRRLRQRSSSNDAERGVMLPLGEQRAQAMTCFEWTSAPAAVQRASPSAGPHHLASPYLCAVLSKNLGKQT